MRIQTAPFGRNTFKRSVAIITAAIFLFTGLPNDMPQAFAKSANDIPVRGGKSLPAGRQASGLHRLIRDEEIRIPPELGKIDEVYFASDDGQRMADGDKSGFEPSALRHPPSSKTIVFVQDAHDSLEAQENIAKIINHLVASYGVKTVFEEGYEGPVPTDKYFGLIKDPKIREKVSYFLMDHLRLGGAEFAHINRTKDFNLLGADSLKLHKENIGQYRLSAAKKDVIAKDLKALDKELKSLADARFPKALKEWLKIKEQFDAKKLDLFTYLGRTIPLADSVERGADSEKLNATRSMINADGLLRFLLEAVKTNNPAVIEKAKHIDAREVFGELIKLEQAMAEIYLHDGADKQLFEYYEILGLLRRLNDLQVSQEEYEAVKASLKTFDTDSFARFIFSQAPKTLILSRMWERNIKDAIKFYEIAKERDHSLESALDKYLAVGTADQRPATKDSLSPGERIGEGKSLQSLPRRQAGPVSGLQSAKTKTDVAVLVFGGFHKENIKRMLEAKGISYLVVSPRITKASPRHEQFYKQLMTVGMHPFEKMILPATAVPVERIYELPNGLAEVWEVCKTAMLYPDQPGTWDRHLTTSERSEVRDENAAVVPAPGLSALRKLEMPQKIEAHETVILSALGKYIRDGIVYRQNLHAQYDRTPEAREWTSRRLYPVNIYEPVSDLEIEETLRALSEKEGLWQLFRSYGPPQAVHEFTYESSGTDGVMVAGGISIGAAAIKYIFDQQETDFWGNDSYLEAWYGLKTWKNKWKRDAFADAVLGLIFETRRIVAEEKIGLEAALREAVRYLDAALKGLYSTGIDYAKPELKLGPGREDKAFGWDTYVDLFREGRGVAHFRRAVENVLGVTYEDGPQIHTGLSILFDSEIWLKGPTPVFAPNVLRPVFSRLTESQGGALLKILLDRILVSAPEHIADQWVDAIDAVDELGRLIFERGLTAGSDLKTILELAGEWAGVEDLSKILGDAVAGTKSQGTAPKKKKLRNYEREKARLAPYVADFERSYPDFNRRIREQNAALAYRILGVRRNAQDAEIKEAYRDQAFLFYPFFPQDPGGKEKEAVFKVLALARETINKKTAGRSEMRRAFTDDDVRAALDLERISPRSAEAALARYPLKDILGFFERLKIFEARFQRLLGEDVKVEEIFFVPAEGERKHPFDYQGEIGIAPNSGRLVLGSRYEDLLGTLNYDLPHEFSHLLLHNRHWAERALPASVRESFVPSGYPLQREIGEMILWQNEKWVGAKIFESLLHTEGFRHPLFGKLVLPVKDGGQVLKFFGGEILLEATLELLALRAGPMLATDPEAYRKEEERILMRYQKSFLELPPKEHLFYGANIARDIVLCRMRDYPEIEKGFQTVIKAWPKAERVAFDELVDNFTFLWNSFSPLNANLSTAVRSEVRGNSQANLTTKEAIAQAILGLSLEEEKIKSDQPVLSEKEISEIRMAPDEALFPLAQRRRWIDVGTTWVVQSEWIKEALARDRYLDILDLYRASISPLHLWKYILLIDRAVEFANARQKDVLSGYQIALNGDWYNQKEELSKMIDGHFIKIFDYIRGINPAVDPHALFELYRPIVQKHRNEFESSSGVVESYSSSSVEHDRYGQWEEYDRPVEQDSRLDFLRKKIGIPDVSFRETASGEWGPDYYGNGHYYTQFYNNFYVTTPEFDALLRFSFLAGEEKLRKVVLSGTDHNQSMTTDEIRSIMNAGVRFLGKSRGEGSIGSKESGFLLLDRLGLPYPNGIVLSEKLIQAMSQMNLSEKRIAVSYLLELLAQVGIRVGEEKLGVRSNPKQSMPGILMTKGKVNSSVDALRVALDSVKDSWYSGQATSYRKRHGLDDSYDLPIIIQAWKSGESPDQSYAKKKEMNMPLPLYASGVFSTRNPDTNENTLWGRYDLNQEGAELMTYGSEGADVRGLANVAPGLWQQLLDAKKKLEEAAGPQEVEFVVSDGKLYFVQTRNLHFSPQAEIAYIRELLAAKKITDVRAMPFLEALQERLHNRKVYKIKQDVSLKKIAKTEASTPGAFQGRLVFSGNSARHYMDQGEPVILVLGRAQTEVLLSLMSTHSNFGLVTTLYGNMSSHEAVLTRSAGIPSLINLKCYQQEHTLFDINQKPLLQEGDWAVIDGDNGILYEATTENVLEENGVVRDASYGIDIPEMRKVFTAPYLNTDGGIKSEFTAERLEELNKAAAEKYKNAEASGDRKAAFTANLEKHFLHDLWIGVQQTSRSRSDPPSQRSEGRIRPDRNEDQAEMRDDLNPSLETLSDSLQPEDRFLDNAIWDLEISEKRGRPAFQEFETELGQPESAQRLPGYIERSIAAYLKTIPDVKKTSPFIPLVAKGSVWMAIRFMLMSGGANYHYLNHAKMEENIFIRTKDARLFFRKSRGINRRRGDGLPAHAYRNSPIREVVAADLGRLIGANTAETFKIGNSSFSLLSFMADPKELPQKTVEGAESAALAFSVFVRKWDDTKEMINRARVGKTFVMFDHDEALNRSTLDIHRYLGALKRLLAIKEKQGFQAGDFDPKTILEVVQRVETMNVPAALQRIRAERFPDDEMSDIDRYAEFLLATQKTIRQDVELVYEAITGQKLMLPERDAPLPLSEKSEEETITDFLIKTQARFWDSGDSEDIIRLNPGFIARRLGMASNRVTKTLLKMKTITRGENSYPVSALVSDLYGPSGMVPGTMGTGIDVAWTARSEMRTVLESKKTHFLMDATLPGNMFFAIDAKTLAGLGMGARSETRNRLWDELLILKKIYGKALKIFVTGDVTGKAEDRVRELSSLGGQVFTGSAAFQVPGNANVIYFTGDIEANLQVLPEKLRQRVRAVFQGLRAADFIAAVRLAKSSLLEEVSSKMKNIRQVIADRLGFDPVGDLKILLDAFVVISRAA